ncbi:uncharacterized protein MONBRDRAFT_14600 [Monosiga brevicollis MX1]|uniref:Protein-tyrosine-phosphatase n=1 Tax=Monosiga brevicollis TaxID=81824 RepID=A9URR7_MONBE|nr:uncharacterized protein MONBRDRAFT_14600 [Monosiga brevicollis MX1]EDQ91652.1 predicted protein [Monosiga brevicollis MX1]|eukprot:XP_001742938.1 hypothetical protein [Monosiga brevicollis MX1]
MSQVLSYLFLGSAVDASNLAALREHRITAILNITTDVPNTFADSLQYQQIPILDTSEQNIQNYFEVAFEFINQAKQYGRNVLVHCQAGISRSAAFVIGYLMYERNMNLNDAHNYVSVCRSIISPNLAFMGELKEYEGKLAHDRSSKTTPTCPNQVIQAVPTW